MDVFLLLVACVVAAGVPLGICVVLRVLMGRGSGEDVDADAVGEDEGVGDHGGLIALRGAARGGETRGGSAAVTGAGTGTGAGVLAGLRADVEAVERHARALELAAQVAGGVL